MKLKTITALILFAFTIKGTVGRLDRPHNRSHKKRQNRKSQAKKGNRSSSRKRGYGEGMRSHIRKGVLRSGKRAYGHHGGPDHHDHHPKKESASQEILSHLDSGHKTVESKCSAIEDRFLCDRQLEDGIDSVFVCRTFTVPLQKVPHQETSCIPEDKIVDSDTCGCCDEQCPEACSCPCVMRDGKAGVKVNTEDALTLNENCVLPDIALRLVATSMGGITCNTNCAATASDGNTAKGHIEEVQTFAGKMARGS